MVLTLLVLDQNLILVLIPTKPHICVYKSLEIHHPRETKKNLSIELEKKL